jgi:hypothetical protein
VNVLPCLTAEFGGSVRATRNPDAGSLGGAYIGFPWLASGPMGSYESTIWGSAVIQKGQTCRMTAGRLFQLLGLDNPSAELHVDAIGRAV